MNNTKLEIKYREAVSKLISQLKRDIAKFSADMTMEELKELKATIDEEIEKRRRIGI